MEPHAPRTPADFATLYELVRDDLMANVAGHRDVIRRLALLGTRHLGGADMGRGLLIGPPGCGKTTLISALAEALDLPTLTIDISNLAEQNWSGSDLGDHLRIMIAPLIQEHGVRKGMQLAERAVILADEIDKVRIPRRSSPSTQDYRTGKQQTLLGLLGGGSIPIEMPGTDLQWSSKSALVIGAGVFNGLVVPNPSTPDLVRWGLMPELAERLCLGGIYRLQPLTGYELRRVLRLGMVGSGVAFRDFGYTLVVPDETLAFASAHVEAHPDGIGPRSAIGWLTAAAEEALIKLMEESAPVGSAFLLTPDDLRLP